jgi:hypothetical protein
MWLAWTRYPDCTRCRYEERKFPHREMFRRSGLMQTCSPVWMGQGMRRQTPELTPVVVGPVVHLIGSVLPIVCFCKSPKGLWRLDSSARDLVIVRVEASWRHRESAASKDAVASGPYASHKRDWPFAVPHWDPQSACGEYDIV